MQNNNQTENRPSVPQSLPKQENPREVQAPTVQNVEVEIEQPFSGDKKQSGDKKKKWNIQRPWELSLARKIITIIFGLLFLWCAAPIFFGIINIGVITSSLITLFIAAAAYFWNVVEENWSIKTGVVCTVVGLVFSAGMIAFCIVSGIMLKASLTEVPEYCSNYTVVVLGCKAHGEEPSWMLEDRLDEAYKVLQENPNISCVVTGGRGDDEEYSEAHVMKKYLVDKGISPDRIIMEENSESTEENLLYTKAAIELNGLSRNIVIVTDRFHELRARMWAEKAGFENIYSSCCDTKPYLVTGYWFREMFGLARLYLFGY